MDPAYGKAYADLYRTHWWWRAREIVVLREIERALASSHQAPLPFRREERPRILDVGCGDGLFFDRLLEFADVAGIESEATLITPANPHRGRIHIGLPDESFQPSEPYDIILMLDVLEHIQQPAPVLRRALELMAPGGHAIITVPAFQGLWTTHDDLNHHFVRYTKRTFRQLADSAGMTIERERYLFHWTFLPKLASHYAEAVLKPKPSLPKTPPKVLNGMLAAISVGEAVLFENLPLPFGSSLLVTGTADGRAGL